MSTVRVKIKPIPLGRGSKTSWMITVVSEKLLPVIWKRKIAKKEKIRAKM